MGKIFLLLVSIILAVLLGRAYWAWQKTLETKSQLETAEYVVQPNDIRATTSTVGSSTTIIIGGENIQ